MIASPARRRIGIAVGVVLSIGVLVLLVGRGRRSPGPEAPSAGRPVAGAGADAPALGGAAPVQAGQRWEKDEVPMPGCWPSLRDFDRAATIDDLHRAITAVGGQDVLLAGYLQERLTELIGGDVARARAVLAWAAQASGPELEILLAALKAAPAVRDPSIAGGLLAIGEDETASPDLRSRALDALETQQRFDPPTMGRLKAIALDERSDAAAWMATRTLGRVMTEDFERTGAYAPYWQELLSIGRESEETAVQLLALEMPSYADPVIDGDSIDDLAKLLREDPDRNVREMAAHRLSITRSPDRVLEVYRAAFPAEQDECVRWAIFRFAVRVAGGGSLPLLAELAAIDPRFEPDRQDFAALYATGAVDFSRIWLGKTERHQCLGVEE